MQCPNVHRRMDAVKRSLRVQKDLLISAAQLKAAPTYLPVAYCDTLAGFVRGFDMIRLKAVDAQNLWELMRLRVRPEQEDFVARNLESIAEAYVTEHDGKVALPFGIYADDVPVGFVMFGYGVVDSEDDPPVADGNYCIWRFMIAAEH